MRLTASPRFPPLLPLTLPLLLLLLLSPIAAVQASSKRRQHVFTTPSQTHSDPNAHLASPHPRAYKIAIIGAGPGGTSAAYFLSQAQRILESQGKGNQGFDVTVFEKEERVGGRTAIVHPYDDEELEPVELGASIFADVNMNLKRASRDFGLDTSARLDEGGSMGIWDGEQFLFEGNQTSWWTSAKFLWRYGYALGTTQKIVKKLVSNFVRLYDPSWLHKPSSWSDGEASEGTVSGFPWRDMNEVAKAIQLKDVAAVSGAEYFNKENGVAKIFVEEIIESATLVNYGQDIYSIHGVGAGVSLAADGAKGIKGGNKLLFEQFLGRSGARLRLGTSGQVTGLVKFANAEEAVRSGRIGEREVRELAFDLPSSLNGTVTHEAPGDKAQPKTADSPVWWLGTSSGFGSLYDYVLIAAPWASSGITLMNTHAQVPAFEYVNLHVTILVTNCSTPNPVYFGRGSQDEVPNMVLTSRETVRKMGAKGNAKRKGRIGLAGAAAKMETKKPKLEFNSLNYLAKLERKDGIPPGGAEEHVVKIFSETELPDSKLDQIMGSSCVNWVHRKVWDAYPYLSPTPQLPTLTPDDHLLYLNGFERLVSTMETATVSARNAVALVLEETLGREFVSGGEDCPWEKGVEGKWWRWGKAKAKTQAKAKGNRSVGMTNDGEFSDWAGWGCRSG